MKQSIGIAVLVAAWAAVAVGGPVPLKFDGGNGSSQVDQYPGTSGSGWGTAWSARGYRAGGGSPTMTASVVSTTPLDGGGNYLETSTSDGRGMFCRRYDTSSGSLDATAPHAVQFTYRLDSKSAGFASGGRPVAIADSTGAGSSTSGANTWYAQVHNDNLWRGYNAVTTVPVVEGTVYDITVMVRPADNQYELYVTDGTHTDVTTSDFRRKDGNVGGYLLFGMDSNGAAGGINGESVAFSLDGVKVLPAAIVWSKSGGGSWYSSANWSMVGPPISTTDAVIDNGGNAAVRDYTGATAEVKTLYLGATTSGSGTIAWRAGATVDLHVYEDLVVGEDGRGTVLLTTADADGKTLTVDNNLYVGRRSGSTGTVTQDRGSVAVPNAGVYVGNEGTGAYNLGGTGTLTVGDPASPNLSDMDLYVGYAGTGYFNQSGGDVTVRSNLFVGQAAGSTGEYTMQGGTLTLYGARTSSSHPKHSATIGVSGTGTFTQTGGGVFVAGNDLEVGRNGGSLGTYNLSGATSTLTLNDDFFIGRNGTGIFNQDGGSVNARDTFILGVGAAGRGEYHLTDGTFLARNANNPDGPKIGSSGTGIFTQSGGSATFQSTQGQSFILGNGSTGHGEYSISAGALNVEIAMIVGNAGTGLFHIIGDDATINVDGYTQSAQSTLQLDINGISAIDVDGLVALAGGLEVTFVAPPEAGQDFIVIINDSDDAVDGIFDGKPEGEYFHSAGTDRALYVTYLANVDGGRIGNDVAIHVTPEPTSLALLGLGFGALAARRKRRS